MSISWPRVITRAAEIVRSYDTGVSLRQLFYRLVVEGAIPNSEYAYKRLSRVTAALRRNGQFPQLVDQTRDIHRFGGFSSPQDALKSLTRSYCRNRDERQEYSVYLGVEKYGMVPQLKQWFETYGVAIAPLRGYSSQTYVDVIIEDVTNNDRQAVLIYAGDFDPSGVDILRDFKKRCSCFDHVQRIALNEDQVSEYNLPANPGKKGDSRAAGFIRDYGQLMQVELDALPPYTLRELYEAALFEFYDTSVFYGVLRAERVDREKLWAIANGEHRA